MHVARSARGAVAAATLIYVTGCATAVFPKHIVLESTAQYAELVELMEKEVSETPDPSTTLLYRLCNAYSKVKDYGKLFRCANRLEDRIRSGDTKVTLYTSLFPSSASPTPHLFRSQAYIELGQYEQAIAEAEKANRLAADVSNTFLGVEKTQHTLQSLGLIALAQALAGRRTEATQTLEKLKNLPLPVKVSAQTKPMKIRAMALVHMALSEYQSALDILLQESDAFTRGLANVLVGGGQNLFATLELPIEYMKGRCLLETGSIREAKAALDELLENERTKNVGEIYWLILFDRGRIAEQEEQLDAAIRFYLSAVEVIERQRASIRTEAGKIGFVGDKQNVYWRLIRLLIRQGDVTEAFDFVERSKARALVDMLSSKNDFAVPGVDSRETSQILKQLDEADLATRIEGAGRLVGDASVRDLQSFQVQIRDKAPELSTLVTVSSVPFGELREMLHGAETLVEYYYRHQELYVFALTDKTLRAVSLDATGLEDDVRALRAAMGHPESSAWRKPARNLYNRLWAPVEPLVAGKNVTIVAHGVLHYLPYGILQAPTGDYVIDRFNLRFLPSASIIKFLKPRAIGSNDAILVIGNPDLGNPGLDLKYAETESSDIAKMFSRSKLLVRKEATETNFKKEHGSFSRIHFATHGKFQPDEPLASGLLLANDAMNDGVVTVGDLYSMSLDTDLVTLSACETGLGKIGNGDDVVGLVRGFMYAGTRSVVASLWKVDDRATAQLMRKFYEGLNKFPKQEALRQAQLSVRQDFPHPFFWGAFQLTGRGE